MTLATVSGGLPWATDVSFAPQGWNLVILSSPTSRRCRNLATQPACPVTVHPPVAARRDIRGVQMEDVVHAAGPIGAMPEMLSHLAGLPFVRDLLANPGIMATNMAKVSLHVFTPSRVRDLDDAQGFGSRFLVGFVDGAAVGPPVREPGS